MAENGFMRRALQLAEAADGAVAPRPAVGAVIVTPSGEIVGEGITQAAPGPHAEIAALRQAGERARGATAYVTLEPCGHTGATPPCAHALVEAGIRRVVAGCRDPNPAVRGRGLAYLRAAGVEVRTGVLGRSARARIEPFARWVTTGRPLVTIKLAATLDGRAAAPDGTSQWITGPQAREEVHELRRRVDAVVVGAGTVGADDPSLTCRLPGYEGPQPRRVVLDSTGRTSTEARVFDGTAPVIILTGDGASVDRRRAWAKAGADVRVLPAGPGGVALEPALQTLGELGVCHALVEGGPTLAASVVDAGLADRFRIYVAPTVLGRGMPAFEGGGVQTLADARSLVIERVGRVGSDVRIDARARRENAPTDDERGRRD